MYKIVHQLFRQKRLIQDQESCLLPVFFKLYEDDHKPYCMVMAHDCKYVFCLEFFSS